MIAIISAMVKKLLYENHLLFHLVQKLLCEMLAIISFS